MDAESIVAILKTVCNDEEEIIQHLCTFLDELDSSLPATPPILKQFRDWVYDVCDEEDEDEDLDIE